MLMAVHTGQLLSFRLQMLGCRHPDYMPGQDQSKSPSLRLHISMGQEELQLALNSSKPRTAWIIRTWERDGAGSLEMLQPATKKEA